MLIADRMWSWHEREGEDDFGLNSWRGEDRFFKKKMYKGCKLQKLDIFKAKLSKYVSKKERQHQREEDKSKQEYLSLSYNSYECRGYGVNMVAIIFAVYHVICCVNKQCFRN